MNKRGYTIAELIFAIMLLTVFLLLNIGIYRTALTNSKEAERLTQAISIATTKTEQLQMTDYDDIASESEYYPYVDNDNYIVSVNVTEDPDTLTVDEIEYDVFKNITVTVTYIVGGKENTIDIKSLKVNNNLVDAIYGESTI